MIYDDYKKDMEIVEIAKIDTTVQTEDIAEFYIEKCKILEKHNEILFNTIKSQIEQFEREPLFEDGTHRLIVGHETLIKLKNTLKSVGYNFD